MNDQDEISTVLDPLNNILFATSIIKKMEYPKNKQYEKCLNIIEKSVKQLIDNHKDFDIKVT